MSGETKERSASWVPGVSRWEERPRCFPGRGGGVDVGGQGIWGQRSDIWDQMWGIRLGIGRSEVRVSEASLESGYVIRGLVIR